MPQYRIPFKDFRVKGAPLIRVVAHADQFELVPASWDEFQDIPDQRNPETGEIPKRVTVVTDIHALSTEWITVNVDEVLMFKSHNSRLFEDK